MKEISLELLSDEIKKYIDQSVLCWLATSSDDNTPNVSPKEIFTYHEDKYIIIANLASPGSVKNIGQNNKVSLSFIDVLIQKGFQLKGLAEIIKISNPEFNVLAKKLLVLTDGKFPFASIIKITIKQVNRIIAPKYKLYPETTEAEQIKSAKISYNL